MTKQGGKVHAMITDMYATSKQGQNTIRETAKYCTTHSVSPGVIATMQEVGILKKIEGSRGEYAWDTESPTLSMAENLVISDRARTKRIQAEKKNGIPVEEVNRRYVRIEHMGLSEMLTAMKDLAAIGSKYGVESGNHLAFGEEVIRYFMDPKKEGKQ